MKALLGIALAVVTGATALGAGMTSLELDGTTYTNIGDVHVSGNGGIFIFAANGMTVVSADKLPDDFLASWNITRESAANAAAKKSEEVQARQSQALSAAIAAGDFREIDGMVYDTRSPASGWSRISEAKIIQLLGDGSAIMDITPESSDYFPVRVKNLPTTVADTDTFSFIAKQTGNFSYQNKYGDERTIREYDLGRVCVRDEIPPSVLMGQKAFDVAAQDGRSTKDVVASLPEAEDLKATGSGFFITDDGYLITNFHVVKDAKGVKVKNSSGVYPAEIVHTDEDNDLALLKISGKFQPLFIATNDVQLGQGVFTIGFPDIALQGTQPKYTDGKISSLAGIQDDPKDYQISVPVQPGNSGGPLVDMNGNVVGVVEAKLDFLAALNSSGDLPQNVNYAIKARYLSTFLDQFPDVKLSSARPISPNEVVQSTQQSVAIVLVY